MTVLAGVYVLGVVAGLVFTDARGPARVALALLWPLGPLAFIIVLAILFLASLIAFPIFGAVVLAALLGAAAVFAQAPDGSPEGLPYIQARFIGNMAYAVTDGRTTLFTDFPYESGYSIYMEYDPREIRSSTQASLSLITHRHGDHWDRPAFEKTTWNVIGPADALAGVDAARVVRSLPVVPARATTKVEEMTIDALPTPHANIGHYSYLVTWHGRRLYFTGDTDDTAQLLDVKNLDVAFVSPWLFEAVQRSGRRIDARRIVIYHQTADATVAGCTGTCSVPKQGETLRF
jgi:L-ascorbate metabolism protein UlaG (beta-lactamase superfamily)